MFYLKLIKTQWMMHSENDTQQKRTTTIALIITFSIKFETTKMAHTPILNDKKQ